MMKYEIMMDGNKYLMIAMINWLDQKHNERKSPEKIAIEQYKLLS